MTQEPDINTQYQLRMMTQAITELAERIDQGFDRNSQNLDRLREVVETGFQDLRQVSQQQADTARSLADSVSRLVALLERSS